MTVPDPLTAEGFEYYKRTHGAGARWTGVEQARILVALQAVREAKEAKA